MSHFPTMFRCFSYATTWTDLAGGKRGLDWKRLLNKPLGNRIMNQFSVFLHLHFIQNPRTVGTDRFDA